MGGVVIGEFSAALALAVGCRYLTRQVLVAVRCVQDVEGHHDQDRSGMNAQVERNSPECL